MLLAGETLLLDSGDQVPVDEQGRAGVRVKGIHSKDQHVLTVLPPLRPTRPAGFSSMTAQT